VSGFESLENEDVEPTGEAPWQMAT